ncbi:hypothetical protein Taro_018259 [Colocasia esculenta]|uniref:Septum-promoting GTP-binding protein 1 n=1 Tax=Colocasia esculenta TaxID=4460 RepID=A0A843V1W3_COLES|nr:hypothetical protein [Colocasia esculenta]
MTQLHRALVRLDLRWDLAARIGLLRRFFCFVWERILACSAGRCHGSQYRRLGRSPTALVEAAAAAEGETAMATAAVAPCPPGAVDGDPDLVALKVSLLGDCDIGKTTFMIKYVGDVEEQGGLHMTGLNLMDKVLPVKGARLAFSIWDVGGDHQFLDHVPIACKDAVAILIMFDLTSRCTLNKLVLIMTITLLMLCYSPKCQFCVHAIGWYHQARKWNKTAILILIGTKFDDFVQLPVDMQWTIINQARSYARVMEAALFFSSATHNINVNKIFKFIAAKLFNLPWRIERNLTIGEPIIDF